jgi:DNA-binding MarR family transcriptional regulator
VDKDALSLLRSYEKGPRIWDASAVLPGVYSLEGKGLIEVAGDPRAGAYQLTEAGRKAIRESHPEAPHCRAHLGSAQRLRGMREGEEPVAVD